MRSCDPPVCVVLPSQSSTWPVKLMGADYNSYGVTLLLKTIPWLISCGVSDEIILHHH